MQLKSASFTNLHDRYERACAKLALVARNDTVFGGARALTLARHLDRMGSAVPAQEIVGEVYAASNYSCGRWGVYACPECGSAYLGTEKAYACCAPSEHTTEDYTTVIED